MTQRRIEIRVEVVDQTHDHYRSKYCARLYSDNEPVELATMGYNTFEEADKIADGMRTKLGINRQFRARYWLIDPDKTPPVEVQRDVTFTVPDLHAALIKTNQFLADVPITRVIVEELPS